MHKVGNEKKQFIYPLTCATKKENTPSRCVFLFCSRSEFAPFMTFGEGNGRARGKKLSVVFTEAMSRVASQQSRVSQATGDDTKADGVNKSHLRNQKTKIVRWIAF